MGLPVRELRAAASPTPRALVAHRAAVVGFAVARSSTRVLLESFWESRGVLDPLHRKALVDAAESLDTERMQPLDSAPLATDAPLPGLPATWQLTESTPEVLAASRRLLALQQLLGGAPPQDDDDFLDSDNGFGASGAGGSGGSGSRASAPMRGRGGRGVDVVWMVVREPRLLSADLVQLTGRLLEMKLATLGSGVDVLELAEAQPALLLSDSWRLDLQSLQAPSPPSAPTSVHDATTAGIEAPHPYVPAAAAVRLEPAADAAPTSLQATPPANGPSGTGATASHGLQSASLGPSSEPRSESSAVQELVQAWQHGIASDGDREWAERLGALESYKSRHGDTGVGFREGDDPELSRWAAKQRTDWRRGRLAPKRLHQLSSLGFLFDADEAEWVRWFGDLVAFKRTTGHASPMPLVTGADMYLINWCSIQRIARRSRVLSESRIQRLDELGFDWTGADPLS